MGLFHEGVTTGCETALFRGFRAWNVDAAPPQEAGLLKNITAMRFHKRAVKKNGITGIRKAPFLLG